MLSKQYDDMRWNYCAALEIEAFHRSATPAKHASVPGILRAATLILLHDKPLRSTHQVRDVRFVGEVCHNVLSSSRISKERLLPSGQRYASFAAALLVSVPHRTPCTGRLAIVLVLVLVIIVVFRCRRRRGWGSVADSSCPCALPRDCAWRHDPGRACIPNVELSELSPYWVEGPQVARCWNGTRQDSHEEEA